jgi:CubicO group peptidase (beta-lactamase class C family)
MSASGLSKVGIERVHNTVAGYVDRDEIPGLVALVHRRGETFVDTIGVRTRGSTDRVGRDTIFRISSMSKPVTAVAVLMLVEDGRARLDDPVDDLLPELANRRVLRTLESELDDTVPAHRAITLRDLLTFRMGFGLVMAPPDAYPITRAIAELAIGSGPPSPDAVVEPNEWMRQIGTLPLMYQPGERWMYNTGSDVLGVFIARAAGTPLEVFLRERIFEPLGMRDTAFHVPPEKLDRFVTAYWTNPFTGATEVFDAIEGQWSHPPAFASGAGGLVSTIDDYLAFARMLLDNGRAGGERLLSRPAVEVMTTDQLTDAQKAHGSFVEGFFDTNGWGFGVSIVTHRADIAYAPGSYGWNGGFGSIWTNDPREEMITILLTQQLWSSPMPPAAMRDFATAAYAAIDD